MAKPLIAVETIYDAALRLLDEQGTAALSARNLAAELHCSTRTLYQQVGKREVLIGKLIEHHLAGLQLEFHPADNWQDSARQWADTIRGALLAHPNLAQLITTEHRPPVAGYVTALLKALLKAGMAEELALRSCRVLVNVALSLSLSEVRTPPRPPRRTRMSPREIQFEEMALAGSGSDPEHFLQAPEVFDNTINWLIQGIAAEHAATAPRE